jgi:hypothetical protein
MIYGQKTRFFPSLLALFYEDASNSKDYKKKNRIEAVFFVLPNI